MLTPVFAGSGCLSLEVVLINLPVAVVKVSFFAVPSRGLLLVVIFFV